MKIKPFIAYFFLASLFLLSGFAFASTTIELFDETPPEAEIYFNSETQQLEIKGTDNTTVNPIVSIIESDEDKEVIYQIEDEAGNTIKLYFEKIETHGHHGKHIKVELESIQYNDNPIIELPKTKLKYKWLLDNDGNIKKLEQKIKAKHRFDVKAKYNYQKDETRIEIKTEEGKEKQALSGLVIIKLTTESGILGFDY